MLDDTSRGWTSWVECWVSRGVPGLVPASSWYFINQLLYASIEFDTQNPSEVFTSFAESIALAVGVLVVVTILWMRLVEWLGLVQKRYYQSNLAEAGVSGIWAGLTVVVALVAIGPRIVNTWGLLEVLMWLHPHSGPLYLYGGTALGLAGLSTGLVVGVTRLMYDLVV